MKSIIVFLIFILFCQKSFCQTQATTDDGKKVWLFQDGTWKYNTSSENTSVPASTLSDNDAKNTVLRIVQRDKRVSALGWYGLIKVNDNQMKARATFKCLIGFTQTPTVEFIFDRNSNNEWILDKMQGISGVITQGCADWTNQTVFEKVTN